MDKEKLRQALIAEGGDLGKVAESLGMTYSQTYYHANKYFNLAVEHKATVTDR